MAGGVDGAPALVGSPTPGSSSFQLQGGKTNQDRRIDPFRWAILGDENEPLRFLSAQISTLTGSAARSRCRPWSCWDCSGA